MTIKGKGMRRMLKKEGFKLYLINEFKTSTLFKHIKNPRPYQRTKILQIKCHSFLSFYIELWT
ncbi:hypothetical protein BDF14DRAFT_1778670 [Spinellus fusiger]|nr:hypothetical protein BDF14DRAFT_1778670 [Spinellus fusiger]